MQNNTIYCLGIYAYVVKVVKKYKGMKIKFRKVVLSGRKGTVKKGVYRRL